jgi:hypothetical protein
MSDVAAVGGLLNALLWKTFGRREARRVDVVSV